MARIAQFRAVAPTPADALMLLYFTSGTTAKPKLVAHSQTSYAVGHLSTAYWIGLRRGDVHLNLSSPGWAKHAWSCFFAPWNAEATVLAYQFERFSAKALLDQLVRCRVTTFCAPPTVWRMLIQEDLRRWPVVLREVVGAGEPLNPEVIDRVKAAWGLTHPGWLRADRDHGADRQSARPAIEAGFHGPAAARLHGGPGRRRRQRGR